MLVKDRMTADPVCGRPDMPVTEIQELMRAKGIRHLPIRGADESLVGLVTQRSLLSALPSDASSFSHFEVTYILGRIKASHVMVEDVITIDENTAVEEAALVMARRKIGCLPVMRSGELVGIITDNDLFTIMVDLLGASRPGQRVTVVQPDRAGEVARLTAAVHQAGGYLSVCVGYFPPEPDSWVSVLKVSNLSKEQLIDAIKSLDEVELRDLREKTVDAEGGGVPE